MAIGLHYRAFVKRKNVLAARLTEFGMDESGADLIEYALLVGLIAGGCVFALTDLKAGIIDLFSSVADRVSGSIQ